MRYDRIEVMLDFTECTQVNLASSIFLKKFYGHFLWCP